MERYLKVMLCVLVLGWMCVLVIVVREGGWSVNATCALAVLAALPLALAVVWRWRGPS